MTAKTDNKTAVEEFLSGKLAYVDVAAIERELKTLWHEASLPTDSNSELVVARACSLNLIFYATGDLIYDTNAEGRFNNWLDQIMLNHPCRAILAINMISKQLQIEAWVSARCHKVGPNKQICCEMITVKSQGQNIEALSSVITPLLVPDLPVFVWWHSDSLDCKVIEPLTSYTNNLIIDSMLFKNEKECFKQLQTMPSANTSHLQISDLNWVRLLPWRKILSKSFDVLDFGLKIDDLHKIENIVIEFAAGNISQAALLTGWLANQLGWSPKAANISDEGSTYNFTFENKTSEVKSLVVEWAEAKSKIIDSGNIVNLKLNCLDSGTLEIKLDTLDSSLILTACMHSIQGNNREVIGHGTDLDTANLANYCLEQINGDPIYEKAKQMASKILDLL